MALSRCSDHPRLRGEKQFRRSLQNQAVGSSPLARGKAPELDKHGHEIGIIPACAGKSPPRSFKFLKHKDHPRLRGEKVKYILFYSLCLGSSPLARGKAIAPRPSAASSRIIPACAGKSNISLPLRSQKPDHPRLRGEKSMTVLIRLADFGSSPLARGKGQYHF